MSVDYTAIGKRIKTKRKSCGKTQEQIAEQLDVTVGYVSQVERGVTKINLDLLSRISTILDSDIAYFITGVSADRSTYLLDELTEKFAQLTREQKQFVMSLIELQLAKNKEK